jgi:hypothetical protein
MRCSILHVNLCLFNETHVNKACNLLLHTAHQRLAKDEYEAKITEHLGQGRELQFKLNDVSRTLEDRIQRLETENKALREASLAHETESRAWQEASSAHEVVAPARWRVCCHAAFTLP